MGKVESFSPFFRVTYRGLFLMCFRGKLSIIIAVVLAAIVSGSAWAGFRPKVGVYEADGDGVVTINGRPAVRFQVPNGALEPAGRAKMASERLSALVAGGLNPRAIAIKSDRYRARIYVGDSPICVATPQDAKANHSTPFALAHLWVSRMRSLLLMPAITLSDKSLLIPLGEKRSVDVGGAAAGPISTSIGDESIAAVSSNDYGRFVQVTGQKVGSTKVEVSIEGETVTLTVNVKKYAGRVADMAFAKVTGNPCPAATLGYAAKQAALQSVVLEPGATVRWGKVDYNGGSLSSDKTRRVDITATISGDGYIPYVGKAVVQVSNVPMPREEVKQLFYSNNPERLEKYQTLFAGKMELDKATRLLFHHQNAMGKRAHFVVELINPNASSASFRVFRGVSSPLVDTILVGYAASSAFLKEYTNEVSVVETVPPMSRLILVSDMLRNNDTTSGVIEMRQISGSTAYVRVASNPPGMDNVATGQIAASPNPFAISLSDHVYPSPTKTLDADYEVGKQWAFIPIGKHAVTDVTAQKKLYGNYGVTYTINVRVHNPTDKTKKVTVAFDPTAGAASGVFMIDGAFVAMRYALPPDDVPLASYQLKPGETRLVNIVTVPVAGSNYPATLVVRS